MRDVDWEKLGKVDWEKLGRVGWDKVGRVHWDKVGRVDWDEVGRVDWERLSRANDLISSISTVTSAEIAAGNSTTPLIQGLADIYASRFVQASSWLADLDFRLSRSPIIEAFNSLANTDFSQSPIVQAYNSLASLDFKQHEFFQTMNSISMSIENWHSNFSLHLEPFELFFKTKLPEIESLAISQAAQSGIFDVAEELLETYDFSQLKVFATWLDTPFASESFTLDFGDLFDFEDDEDDEPVVTIPRRNPHLRSKRRKASAAPTPLEQIDTTTQVTQQPVIVKRIVQKVSDNKEVSIVVMGSHISAGALNNGVYGALAGAAVGTATLVVTLRDKS